MIVFVYGTLMRGYGNNRLLESSKFLGRANLKPTAGFKMYDCGWFPGVKQVEGKGTHIKGELYECNDNVLVSLDYLEGYPTLYDRVEIKTHKGPCWIYTYQHERQPTDLIPNGDWRKYEQAKRSHR